MGTLWCSCAKVHEAIELLFWVVSGVDPGIGVLDWGSGLPRRRGGFGGFSGPLV